MAYLFHPDVVRYVCGCGSLKPISRLYFCKHCMQTRCGYCVAHEVDSHYCPNCMENLPFSEVRLKKNKCSNCFDCPCCFQTLTIRAGHAPIRPVQSDEVKQTPRKVYYLSCSLCRWSSRDAGIPDQSVATGGWPDQENPHTARITALNDYHKILGSRERQQVDKKKFDPKRTCLQFEKFGITSALARRLAGLPAPSNEQKFHYGEFSQPSIATETVDELPLSIFTEQIDVTKLTTLEQRFQQPELQAEHINELRPQHKKFPVKRSQRCRSCEHNVSKPEFSPQSIKFKIQSSAFYHIPEVRIVTFEPLIVGKQSELLIKFINPSQYQTQISLFKWNSETKAMMVGASGQMEELRRENLQLGGESPNLMPAAVRQVYVMEDPKPVKMIPGADVELPKNPLILPARDDTTEYDDANDAYAYQDDPKIVVWRKSNKAVLKLKITPYAPTEDKKDEPIIVGFVMQFEYVNTLAIVDQNNPQKVDLKLQLFLKLDKLGGSLVKKVEI